MADGGWIVVCRWDDFQHRDMTRSAVPPWIKVYTNLLHNDAYLGLTGHQRAVLHGLWLEYASTHGHLPLTTRSLTRRLHLRVMLRDIEALNHAGFIEVSAVKPAVAVASLDVDVDVEKEVLRTSTNTGIAANGNGGPVDNKPRRYDELLAAARRFTADWKGGTSDAFDAGLDELERLTGGRLQAGDRYRLWDEAWAKP